MSTLTGDEIIKMREQGRLTIEPFDERRVGTNSYDLALGDKLKIYTGLKLSTRKKNPTQEIIIPEEGFELQPREGYLGSTVEACGSDEFLCNINGRSSIGRLFLLVHCTAGNGDLGFGHRVKGCLEDPEEWTLELASVTFRPVEVFAGDIIAQATFDTVVGDRIRQYKGRYKGQKGPIESKVEQANRMTLYDASEALSVELKNLCDPSRPCCNVGVGKDMIVVYVMRKEFATDRLLSNLKTYAGWPVQVVRTGPMRLLGDGES